MLVLLIALFTVFVTSTTENFQVNNRQVSASWSICGPCICEYFDLYAFEHTTQNPSDPTPPIYLYYSHSIYDNCLNIYSSEWLQSTGPLPGLEIFRLGSSAELVTGNMTDSNGHIVSINLSWSTIDSNNTGNCNCQDVHSYGIEHFRVSSKSSYSKARVIGSVTIDGVIHTLPTETYSFISGYGQKIVVLKHH